MRQENASFFYYVFPAFSCILAVGTVLLFTPASQPPSPEASAPASSTVPGFDIPMNDESSCLVIPMDFRIPKIRIKTNGWQRFIGQRLWVEIDGWDVSSTYPSGHCAEIIGPIADLETELPPFFPSSSYFLRLH